jgi:hypothetical protein
MGKHGGLLLDATAIWVDKSSLSGVPSCSAQLFYCEKGQMPNYLVAPGGLTACNPRRQHALNENEIRK